MIFSVDNKSPMRVAKFSCAIKVKIQVIGNVTIRFAPTSSELNIPGGTQEILDGIQIGQNQIIEWTWVGEMWAIGNQANCQFVMISPGDRESTG